MILNWNTTKGEAQTISKIVQRARDSADLGQIDPLKLDMDISACHLNGCPLDLQGLLNATPGDFNHDISGIVSRIDRETGNLRDCWTPRHHAKEPARRRPHEHGGALTCQCQ